jgi:DnaJ-class molecular chaperone
MLRLKGKGIRDPKTLQTGDQYVRLLITLPEGGDPALETFFREHQEPAGGKRRE